MAGRCGRIVKGRPCKAAAVGKTGYCLFHGPRREAQLRKAKRYVKRTAKDVGVRMARDAVRSYRKRRG